MRKAG
jgi:hypothetical protein